MQKIAYNKQLSLGNKNTWTEVNKQGTRKVTPNNSSLAHELNDKFHDVWQRRAQPDISRFIQIQPDPDTPLIFNPANVAQALKKL
jgi:hypothetical protein